MAGRRTTLHDAILGVKNVSLVSTDHAAMSLAAESEKILEDLEEEDELTEKLRHLVQVGPRAVCFVHFTNPNQLL